MNPANLITVGRIALIPAFVYFMNRAGDGNPMTAAGWWALIIYLVATFSDYADGYLARRLHVITRLGQFLDPLADKFLVGAALVTMIAYRQFPVWAALVIAVREVAIVMLRSAAMRRGNSMPAGKHAKYKTSIQLVMTIAWLLPSQGTLVPIQQVLVYVAVAVTVWSGLRYAVMGRQLLTPASGRPESAA
ncbi:MAG: CDP-diacylglycerol--glycerol-3-phosphate 3-phosphatidyltransferase [Actinomycetota bacterium]